MVVSELPTEDIKEGKIYCIRDTSSTAQDNNYIEYAYINNKWEKVGEFQAEPDLSGYAKLNGARFTGKIYTSGMDASGANYISNVRGLRAEIEESNHHVFAVNNTHLDVGSSEYFVFTLEDGSTVTKSIRVISTTTSQAEA